MEVLAAKAGSLKELLERLLYEQAQHIETKWQAFRDGDASAQLTDLEINFLLSLMKLQQDAAVEEAARTYLETLSHAEVYRFYQQVHASLPENDPEALPDQEAPCPRP